MPTLDTLLTLHPTSGGFRVEVPDGWQQGKGAFGGLAFGWCARAAVAAAPDRRLRALAVQLCGPVLPGAASVRVETLRAGGAVTHVSIRVEQGGETVVMALATCGIARADLAWAPAAPPSAPPWSEVGEIPRNPIMPAFSQHFAYRPCVGAWPWSGASEAYTGGWVTPREAGPARDVGVVAALLDTWWPAFLVLQSAPRPMATVSALLQFLGEGGPDDVPNLLVCRSDAAAGGYTVEDRTLWSADGRLVAVCRQNLAVLG